MGLFRTLFPSLFGNQRLNNPAIFKKCSYCYWSGYKGKVCSQTNPPTVITTVNQAHTCIAYTTTEPDPVTPAVDALKLSTDAKLDALKVSTDAVGGAVAGLPTEIKTISMPYELRGGDNGAVAVGFSAGYVLRKTLSLSNCPSERVVLDTLVYSRHKNAAFPAGVLDVKLTVDVGVGEVVVNEELAVSETVETFKSIIFTEKYGSTVIIRLYTRYDSGSGYSMASHLQAFGTNKQAVTY